MDGFNRATRIDRKREKLNDFLCSEEESIEIQLYERELKKFKKEYKEMLSFKVKQENPDHQRTVIVTRIQKQ